MRRAILTRGPSSDEGTFGALELDDGQVLRTTELPWRDNLPTISCIPVGIYRCEIVNSPTKGKVYGVRDVPGRTNILIHVANFGGDKAKGWRTELQGCIAPAMQLGQLPIPGGAMQRAGLRSGDAIGRLMDWGKGMPFELEIRG